MLSVISFLWKPRHGNKGFTAKHVNVLKRMVERNYPHPHRFICITDDSAGIDNDVETIPLWNDFADVPSPHGASYPSCYRRLKMFSREIEAIVGKRFVTLDLDCVIVGDVSALWNRPEAIVLWGKTNPTTHYNGSMMLMTAGARSAVWDDFDIESSPAVAARANQFGSDQGWISYKLGPHEKTWTVMDGVYSHRRHLQSMKSRLPPNARIVFFNGKRTDPSDDSAQRIPWVAKHWN